MLRKAFFCDSLFKYLLKKKLTKIKNPMNPNSSE